MFIAKKIITAKQMKTFRAKNSSVMQDFVAKGGGEIIRKKIGQREFWNALRSDSKSHSVGDKGYTKKSLTKFLGGMLENKKDHFTDRKVKKLADLFGVKRSKLFNAAAEIRNDHSGQIMNVQHTQREAGIKNHINEIISKGRENAKVGSRVLLSNHGEVENHDFQKPVSQENIFNKLERSDNNIRRSGNDFPSANNSQTKANDTGTYGHLSFLKNRHHDFVAEDEMEAEKIKARLARIQGRADNEDIEEEKLAA